MNKLSRRRFLSRMAVAGTVPLIAPITVFGANDRIYMGCIGMGGRGRADMNGFMRFPEVRVIAVCDVVGRHRDLAKQMVDRHYGNKDCKAFKDFRDVVTHPDIDAVLIATPDHWHAIISIAAMKNGKDVFCEKPETLTIREGQEMIRVARQYGRVFSGGSQRVWDDYNWFHKMIWGGAIGRPLEAWMNVGGPSGPCYLPPAPTPPDVDWDLWLGPAPWRPYHPTLITGGFRPYRDYSGGGMTDWGCHGFGGALFALQLHHTGPVEIIPPDGKEYPHLTFVFANGIRIYHGGGWGGILSFRGTDGEIPPRSGERPPAPDIYIPHYKGRGGILGDFLHCVRTRERPFRDIEVAHKTATLCHLGNIAYWLNKRIRWNPKTEEIVDDPDVARWLDREKRAPWSLS